MRLYSLGAPLCVACVVFIGCGRAAHSGSENSTASAPAMGAVTASPNPYNVLAQRLDADIKEGVTARAVWWGPDQVEHVSPSISVPAGGHVSLHVLGLLASTSYFAVVEATNAAGVSRSDPVSFSTSALPTALANVQLNITGTPPDDYVMVNLNTTTNPAMAVIFDGSGNIRWYRLFDVAMPVNETTQLANGNILLFLGWTPGWQPWTGEFVEIAPSGERVRSFSAPAPFFTDDHDIRITDEGTAQERIHLLGYEFHTGVDLTPLGQSGQTGTIAAHSVQRLLPNGDVEFSWAAWDHLSLDEWINPTTPGAYDGFDFDHPNAIDLDADGNYVVSFRNLDSVLGIHSQTGEILWRLGGVHNQFTFVNDPFNGFSGQHCVRVLPNGHLLMLDNGSLHQPPTTRAVEYALDFNAKTATLVWSYTAPPNLFNAFVGSTFRDKQGATWVGLGWNSVVERIGQDGSVLWTGTLMKNGQPNGFYRAVPMGSLYEAIAF